MGRQPEAHLRAKVAGIVVLNAAVLILTVVLTRSVALVIFEIAALCALALIVRAQRRTRT